MGSSRETSVKEVYLENGGYVKISNADVTRWYMLQGYSKYTVKVEDRNTTPVNGVYPKIDETKFVEVNTISSYTLYGGPLNPFEYVTISIPAKKLKERAPDLLKEGGITAGKNHISINYHGKSTNMIVTQANTSGTNIRITAYCPAEQLRGESIAGQIKGDPITIINTILKSSLYLDHPFTGKDSIFYNYDGGLCGRVGEITIPTGMNVWFALQICAMSMGCKIFFCSDRAYIIDYRYIKSGEDIVNDVVYDASQIPVYKLIDIDVNVQKRMVGKPKLGDEGLSVVYNEVTVKGQGDENVGTDTILMYDTVSINQYGERVRDTIETKVLNLRQAALLGEAYLDYHKWSQKSLSFEAKETYRDNNTGLMWEPYLPDVTRARLIVDDYNEVKLDNLDPLGNLAPQKLYLSSFERNYPDGTTTYTFGAIDNNDLAQSTSEIRGA